MSDQCRNCMMRGDYEQCQKTTCGHHDNWISLEHLKLITNLRQQLVEAREMLDNVLYWETCPQEYVDRILRLQGRLKEVEK